MTHIDSIVIDRSDGAAGLFVVLTRRNQGEVLEEDEFDSLWDMTIPVPPDTDEFLDTSSDANEDWRCDRKWVCLSRAVEIFKERQS